MQKRLLITLLTIMLIIILTLTFHISFVNASTVTFSMDTLPENMGWTLIKAGNGTSYVSDGILTIENTVGQIGYLAPDDWSNTVNNTKGWIIEFRMRIEPIVPFVGGGTISVGIHDNRYETQINFYENKIELLLSGQYYFMNTTDTFHVYRIIGQGNIVRVFVDEELVIDSLTRIGLGGEGLAFGSIYPPNVTRKSYWDYFSYDTNPTNLTLTYITYPTLIVVNGTSSYYISNLSGVTLDNQLSAYPILNGTYAGWCIDRSIRMERNRPHNITLYSSLSAMPSAINRYNWSSVNYILNHKQGTMQEIQDAIWYFVPDYVTPRLTETNTWNMINEAKANLNYIPGKGEILAIIAYTGHGSTGESGGGNGVQNTILEYRIP